ncbi:MAG: hypothetical protein U5K84_05855 [Alkalibacterium sp.]|nr:hypothetical protein [Alkalibacterium sp.]
MLFTEVSDERAKDKHPAEILAIVTGIDKNYYRWSKRAWRSERSRQSVTAGHLGRRPEANHRSTQIWATLMPHCYKETMESCSEIRAAFYVCESTGILSAEESHSDLSSNIIE